LRRVSEIRIRAVVFALFTKSVRLPYCLSAHYPALKLLTNFRSLESLGLREKQMPIREKPCHPWFKMESHSRFGLILAFEKQVLYFDLAPEFADKLNPHRT
jgi:hypothetical protein